MQLDQLYFTIIIAKLSFGLELVGRFPYTAN